MVRTMNEQASKSYAAVSTAPNTQSGTVRAACSRKLSSQASCQSVQDKAAQPVTQRKQSQEFSRDDLLKLENQICFPLYVCAKEVVRLYTPFLDELGLTYTQYIALMALWEQDGIAVGQLGSRLYLDSGTLTPLLKKMERSGLVQRRRDENDERKVRVFLTEQGVKLKERVYDVPLKAGSCIALEPDDAQQLWRLLHKMLDVLVP